MGCNGIRTDSSMLSIVKLALRIVDDDFDTELMNLIAAAQQDLGIAGVIIPQSLDPIVRTAIITYVKLHFGQPDDYDRLKLSYDEQKAQLATATGYTNFLED